MKINLNYVETKKAEIKDGLKFAEDREEVNKLVQAQVFDKIKRGNFKGLNLTELKISIFGEIALTMSAISEAKANGFEDEMEELYQKLNDLKLMQKKIEDHIELENETNKRTNPHIKMGAKLTTGSELQEWLIRQEDMQRQGAAANYNIFTYREKKGQQGKQGDFAHELAQNKQLIDTMRLMKLKS